VPIVTALRALRTLMLMGRCQSNAMTELGAQLRRDPFDLGFHPNAHIFIL